VNQADTAIQSYRQIEPTLADRQQFVRDLVERYSVVFHHAPTGLELLRYASGLYPDRSFDVNTIRPRLFELEQQGWVQKGKKRECSISRKTVYTWKLSRPVAPGRLF
jgi:hypothetical protein